MNVDLRTMWRTVNAIGRHKSSTRKIIRRKQATIPQEANSNASFSARLFMAAEHTTLVQIRIRPFRGMLSRKSGVPDA